MCSILKLKYVLGFLGLLFTFALGYTKLKKSNQKTALCV